MRGLNFRIILGLVILIAGVLWLLQDFNLIDTAALNLWSYWPLIPLIVGLDWLVLSFRTSGSSSGKEFSSPGTVCFRPDHDGYRGPLPGAEYGPDRCGDRQQVLADTSACIVDISGVQLAQKARLRKGGSNRLAFMGGGVDIGQKSWKLENGNYLPSWAGSSWI